MNPLLHPTVFRRNGPSRAASAILLIFAACWGGSPEPRTAADSVRAVNESLQYRRSAEEYFRRDPSSPFNTSPPVPFGGLRWFPPDAAYYFTSKLFRHERPETVVVMGTQGEPRRQVRYGYFTIAIDGREYRLNVYKFTQEDISRHPQLAGNLSVWFTDATSGKETYGVGRYVEVEPEQPDPEHVYVVNLNNAHNPYCAYNPTYSCAIPTREDHLPVAIRAGEMSYHTE